MRWLLLFAIVLFAIPALAVDRYVSTSGTNAGGCTNSGSPCQTLIYGTGQMNSGDHLIITPGIYHECLNPEQGWLQVPSGGGTDGTRTVISGTGTGVILRPLSACTKALQFITRSWITIDHLEVNCQDMNGFQSDAAPPGIVVGANSQHVRLQNSIVHDCGNLLMLAGDDNSGKTCLTALCMEKFYEVIDNEFYNSWGYGCYCNASQMTFDGNTYHHTQGYALNIYNSELLIQPGNNTYRNNFFYDIGYGNSGPSMTPSQGMYMWGFSTLFYNNVVVGPATYAGGDGASVYLRQPNGIGVYNNTFYGAPGPAISADPGGSGNIRNNIFYQNGTNGCVIANGSPSGGGPCSTLNIPSNENLNSTGTNTNPLFVNPNSTGNSDFHIGATSPARGIGANLTGNPLPNPSTDKGGIIRPINTAWDAGAYQFTGSPPPADLSPLEDFVYTTSADLSNQNCANGSIHCNNWTGPWIAISGSITVEVAPAGSFSGGNAARSSATGTTNYYFRTIGALTTGSIIGQMRSDVTNNTSSFGLTDDNGDNLVYVVMAPDGHLRSCWTFPQEVDLGNFAADTWYLIEMNLDLAGHPNQARVRVNEGTYTSWFAYCGAPNSAQGTRVYSYDGTSTAHNFYLDTIGAKSTSLTFTSQPVGPYNTGATFSVAVGIAYSDGTTIHTSDTTSIAMTLCVGGPAGTFGGTTPVSPVSGISTFSNLSVTAVNGGIGYNLCSTASGLVSATSNPFNIIGVNQNPGMPGHRPRIRVRIK